MHQIFWGSNATPLVAATVRSGIGDSGMASIDRRTTSSFRQVQGTYRSSRSRVRDARSTDSRRSLYVESFGERTFPAEMKSIASSRPKRTVRSGCLNRVLVW